MSRRSIIIELAIRLIRTNPGFIRFTGMHIAFLALTGDAGRALKLFGTHIANVWEGTDPFDEFHFLRLCWLAVDTISRAKKRAKLRMPRLNDLIAGDREYVLLDLANGIAKRGLNLAEQFDQRNGNDYFTRHWHDTMKWQQYATFDRRKG